MSTLSIHMFSPASSLVFSFSSIDLESPRTPYPTGVYTPATPRYIDFKPPKYRDMVKDDNTVCRNLFEEEFSDANNMQVDSDSDLWANTYEKVAR